MQFAEIEQAVTQFGKGEFVIVVDDEDRENEGDLCLAAVAATQERVNFMMTEARGLICIAMAAERLDELELPPMMEHNTSLYRTAFTVSVDAAGGEVTTGISARDRATTIRALADPEFKASDFTRPGHIFPLRARPGGVLERAGHTEAVIDLCQLAGLTKAGVVCEIANPDGTMARRPELEAFGAQHHIPIISITDLISYRRQQERLVERGAETVIPTDEGTWRAIGYRDRITEAVHLALIFGEPEADRPVLVRVHSECLTGDVFGSQRCDCQAQLQQALKQITAAGEGVVVYLRQEGRGIGLMDKLRAYALQDQGRDTVEANLELGYPADSRDYQIGSQILSDLGLRQLRVMSNNPRKYYGLQGHGLEMVERVPIEIQPNPHNQRYLATKRDKLGHVLAPPEPVPGGAS